MSKVLNDFIKEVVIRKGVDLPMKEIYMFFLEGLNEDFDDDLFLDAMRLLIDC